MESRTLSPAEAKLNRVIFILSIIGMLVAAYVFQSFIRQSSIVCINSGCELVRKNPASYILGIPVPGFGFVGYTILVILSFLRTVSAKSGYLKGILGIAIFGVCFVTWFTLTEIFVIKAACTWCAVSAVLMYVIFFLTLRSMGLENPKSLPAPASTQRGEQAGK